MSCSKSWLVIALMACSLLAVGCRSKIGQNPNLGGSGGTDDEMDSGIQQGSNDDGNGGSGDGGTSGAGQDPNSGGSGGSGEGGTSGTGENPNIGGTAGAGGEPASGTGGEGGAGDGEAGEGGETGLPGPDSGMEPVQDDCFTNPVTHLEIINACTDAVQVDKTPELVGLLPNGDLPPLP